MTPSIRAPLSSSRLAWPVLAAVAVMLSGCILNSHDDRHEPVAEADSYSLESEVVELPVDAPEPEQEAARQLPRVLIIGDSISNGYTPPLKEILADKAEVVHAPGNNQGTTLGVAKLQEWLGDTSWDVIHFNWGLHDLKHVQEPGTTKNSNDPNDPPQATLEQYAENMAQLVAQLKDTGAKLIFATTTPYPEGCKPFRDPVDAVRYNQAALEIMNANDIMVNDLYARALPNLEEWQKPANVHFTKDGSRELAVAVADSILAVIAE